MVRSFTYATLQSIGRGGRSFSPLHLPLPFLLSRLRPGQTSAIRRLYACLCFQFERLGGMFIAVDISHLRGLGLLLRPARTNHGDPTETPAGPRGAGSRTVLVPRRKSPFVTRRAVVTLPLPQKKKTTDMEYNFFLGNLFVNFKIRSHFPLAGFFTIILIF